MLHVCLRRGAALSLTLLVAGATIADAVPREVRYAPKLKVFDEHVSAYEKLRKGVEAKIGKLPKTDDPAQIKSRQHALGEAIRQARTGAKAGDIFEPAVASVFRRLIAHDLHNRPGAERRAFVVSQPDMTVRVNEFYPDSVPLATVPPRLLTALPRLPDGLEYRFVGPDLILLDSEPDLVVDILPGAIPARYRKR